MTDETPEHDPPTPPADEPLDATGAPYSGGVGQTTAHVLLHELVRAERDVLSLGRSHGIPLGTLAQWAADPGTQRTVAGLCLLADLQTQLLLSRYRSSAVARLVAQATGEDEALPPEQVRKACVDLLKIELDRVAAVSLDGAELGDDPALAELRAAMLDESAVGGSEDG